MQINNRISISALKDPIVFIGLGFGSGLSPYAPGTAGTLAAVPIYILMSFLSLETYILITAVITGLGVWICSYISKKLNVHDHPAIVIDEFAGFFVTMMFAPKGWIWVFVGFAVFRFFDAVKPWPISWLDKNVKGGVGIMLDDIVAGIASLLTLLLLSAYIQI